MSLSASEHQLRYIASIKEEIEKQKTTYKKVVRFPTLPQFACEINQFYLKPVIILAPDLQFPHEFVKTFECSDCKSKVKKDGWSTSHRYVHGIDCGSYLLQRRYKCQNRNCSRKTFDALTLLDQCESIPDFVRFAYPIVKGGSTWFHRKLSDLVVSDAISGKTFDEQCQLIQSCRLSDYSTKRASYCSKQSYLRSSGSLKPMDEIFSDMDDKGGFNEILCPDTKTITDFYNSFVKDRIEFIDKCFNAIEIAQILKQDSTFRIQDHTKVQTTEGKFVSIDKNARAFMLNATGEIVATSSAKGETKELIIQLLRSIKARCDKHGWPYPQVIFTDNAIAHEKSIKSVFPDIRVAQDLKHLINRPLEFISKSHPFSGDFSRSFHGAFTMSVEKNVQSRNLNWYKVPGPLDSPEVIIKRVDSVISDYHKNYSDLFNKEFFKTWETQKEQIHKYVFEVYVNGKLSNI